jgi:hypothetical protein
MRSSIRTLLVVVLSACGGGDGDVTNPPAPESFTLTVSGQGTGSGRVVTSAGTSPAIDCTIAANGQATGVCSGTYAEAMSVSLTITPDASSAFSGWTGDASSCGAATTCSLSMTRNRTAVAQLSAIATSPIQITSSAYYPDPEFGTDGAIIWVVEVRNTSSEWVESAQIDFTSHDAAGTILASDFTFVGPIPPGETRASQSLADYLGTEASVDIRVADFRFGEADPLFGAVQIASSNWRPDPEFGLDGEIIWVVEVLNTSTTTLESVRVDFVSYDAAGQILTTDFTFVGPIPPGERRASESFADYFGTEANVQFQISSVR